MFLKVWLKFSTSFNLYPLGFFLSIKLDHAYNWRIEERVYILGGYQSDFAQNWHRNELDLLDVFQDIISKGLNSVDLEPKDVDVAHVGNFTAELFCNQGHLGGFFVSSHPDFFGLPSSRHEAACAMDGAN